MAKYNWPVCLLEEYKIPDGLMAFLSNFAEESSNDHEALEELYEECEMLKGTSAKQGRYIAELEKQLILLQKTLDLIDKNRGVDDG